MLPLMIGGFYMLFHPPEALFAEPTLLALWLFAALFVVHLGYAGVSISYHAHGAELTDDYNERTRVTVGREVFGLMGMTLAVVLPTIFTAKFGDHARATSTWAWSSSRSRSPSPCRRCSGRRPRCIRRSCARTRRSMSAISATGW